jgi:hypothetical protein
VVCGNAFARVIPHTSRRPPQLGWRTLSQLRSRTTGGLRPSRSCVARIRVCWRFTVSGARALPNHGGLTPPLLAVHAFVHRESRHFAGTRSRIQTGAAGVSPPWVAETHLQGRYRKRAGDCRRWAGAGGRYCNRGGRGSVGSVPSNWGWHCERASANHGGLTPPALGCTCVCASRKSSFHRHRFAHSNRSGGRQPAVVCGNAFARAIPQTCGRPWPARWRMSVQSLSPIHGGLTPPALVLRECTPAGDDCRSHVAERCSIFPARRSCYLTTGADAPRSWLYIRLCIAKVAILPAHVRACKQERRA